VLTFVALYGYDRVVHSEVLRKELHSEGP